MALYDDPNFDPNQNYTTEDLKDLMARHSAALRQRESDLNAAPKQVMDRIKMGENSVGPKLPDYTPEETRNAQAANATAMGTLGPVAGEESLVEKAARQAELEATFAKHNPPNLENLIKGPAKSAEEAAQTFEGFQMVGEPYGGSLAKIKPQAPMTTSQPPALRTRVPEVLPAEEAIAQESGTGLAPFKDIETVASGASDDFSQAAANKLALKLGISATAAAALIAKYAPESQNSKAPPSSSPLAQAKQEEPNPFAPNPIDKIEPDQESSFPKVASREVSKPSDQPKKDEIGDLLKSSQAQSLASDANLKDAQHRADMVAMVNQLGKSANQIGAGISKSTATGQELFDQNIKRGDQIVTDLQERIKNQSNDPGSEVSKTARAMLSKVTGKPIPENMSAATLDKIQPGLMHMVTAEENRKARTETAKQSALDRAEYRKTKDQEHERAILDKKDATIDKNFKELVDKATASRILPEVRQSRLDKLNADKALGLFNKPNLNDLTGSEVALGLSEVAKIARGGTPTHEEMKALNLDTLNSDLIKKASYLGNKPIGAQLGARLQPLKEYLLTLRENAVDNVHRSLVSPAKAKLEAGLINQKQYDTFTKEIADEWNFEKIKEKESKEKGYSPSQESGIAAFMAAHPELDREKAIKVLKDNKRL